MSKIPASAIAIKSKPRTDQARIRDNEGVRAGIGFALAAALCVLSIGCGGSEGARPEGPLADALSEVSGSASASGSLGVGWTEPRLARAAGVDPELMAAALGPNAGSVLDASRRLQRRFSLDPLAARRLLSVGGSYAFGLRLDGVDAGRLRAALIQAGGGVRQAPEGELVNVGEYAEVPQPLLEARVFGLGARDAFAARAVVLAISETARDSLLGRGERLIDQPTYRAAADCLGDVVAARMIPDKLLISVELGVDLVAVGVGRNSQVICVLGGSPERSREVAANLRAGLAPRAREPRSGRPMRTLVRGVQVMSAEYEGIEVVRAAMRPASRGELGFPFEAIGRGSLPDLINGR